MIINAFYRVKLYSSFLRRVLRGDAIDPGCKFEIVRYMFFSPNYN